MTGILGNTSRRRIVAGIGVLLSLLAWTCRKDDASARKLYNSRYSAQEMDRIGRTVFKDIYFYLARQIKSEYGIERGLCLEIGSGPGYWAIETAKITGLDVKAFDIDPEVLKIAERNIREAGLTERVQTVLGDVVALPYADDSVDLVISRGSYMFWPDKVKAFREIRRVLKPGGIAYIGGGMGNLLPEDDRTRIREQMDKEKIGPPAELELTFPEMGAILRQAGIPEFKIAPDEGCLCGLWVEFRKTSLPPPDKTQL